MGCASERKSPVPEKKQKLSTKSKAEKSASATGKYFCLECLEDWLLGKKEEQFAAICRSDSSSVARHKARWHKIPESQTCTIVPSTSPKLSAVRNRCARPSNEGLEALIPIQLSARKHQRKRVLRNSSRMRLT